MKLTKLEEAMDLSGPTQGKLIFWIIAPVLFFVFVSLFSLPLRALYLFLLTVFGLRVKWLLIIIGSMALLVGYGGAIFTIVWLWRMYKKNIDK